MLIDGQNSAHSKPYGGLISPDAQDRLANFDFVLPREVMSSPQIFSVRVIDLESGKVRFFRRCYLNTDRYEFDRCLFSMVPDTVDEICGRCEKIEKNGLGFTVTVNSDGAKKQFTATNIVDADSIVRLELFNHKYKTEKISRAHTVELFAGMCF